MPPCFELGLLPTGLQAFFHWPFIPSPPIPARTFIFVTLRSFPLADERMESGIESMEQTDEESWTPPPSSLDDVLADKVVFSPQPATYSHLPTTCTCCVSDRQRGVSLRGGGPNGRASSGLRVTGLAMVPHYDRPVR